MRLWSGALALTLVVLAHTAAAQPACPCGPAQSLGQAVHASDAVFEGRVSGLSFLKSEPPYTLAQLKVVRTWKGLGGTEQTAVQTPPAHVERGSIAACTLSLEPQQSYLVFARARQDGQLETSVCTRTKPIEDAGDDLLALGMGAAPVTPQAADAGPAQPQPTTPNEPPARGGCASCSVGARGQERTSAPWLSLGALALVLCARGARRR